MILWNMLNIVRYRNNESHSAGFPFLNGVHIYWITSEIQSKLNYGDLWHAVVSRNHNDSFACISIFSMSYTEGTNATDKKKQQQKKANSPLAYDLGLKGGVLCMHTDEVQTKFMTAWSLLLFMPISTHQWTLEATRLEQTDQASVIHSPPRCLCQVIAGGKRKTDQYISHGPDR